MLRAQKGGQGLFMGNGLARGKKHKRHKCLEGILRWWEMVVKDVLQFQFLTVFAFRENQHQASFLLS